MHANASNPRLWTEVRGHGTRVVLLHGFTQAGASWNTVLQACTEHNFEAVLPDLPGHGYSAAAVIDLNATAEVLANSYGPAVYVGYSMGGRVALHVALRYPQLVRGLLLFGATPGLETESERSQRREDDEILARDLEATNVPAFLERWLSSPLFATLPHDPHDLRLRQQNTVEGLASSLRLSGTGSQASLWNSLDTICAPTIVATGDRDEKFTSIGKAMSVCIGSNASFLAIDDAGHACHLEQPQATADLLTKLLHQIEQ